MNAVDERILNAGREAELSDKEIAVLMVMHDDYNYTEEEIMEIINTEGITLNRYGYDNVEIEEYGEDYYVFDSEEDAEQAAKDEIIDLFDDIGIEGFNLNMDEYVDTEWFWEAMKESYEFYLNDLSPEDLFEQAYDDGFLDEDAFDTDEDGDIDFSSCNRDFDDVVERMLEDWEETHDEADAVQDYINEFGREDFNHVVKENNLVDVEKLAQDCVDMDGRAVSLARYDSVEHEAYFDDTWFYVYRND